MESRYDKQINLLNNVHNLCYILGSLERGVVSKIYIQAVM